MRSLFFVLLLLLSACKSSNQTVQEIEMYNKDGDRVGTAVFTEQSKGVEIKLKVEGLSSGFHGIHIHEYPTCEPPNFQTSGNHLNPDGKEHGLMHPKGPHLGDLQNIEADSSGQVDTKLLTDATLLEGKNSIFQNGGTSLIITENADDGMSQPSGESGARIVCGELTEESATESEKEPSDPTENNEETGT